MNLEQLLEKAIQKAKLEAHPVGSYYFSDISTPPSEIFGGTWVQIKDRFILTAGDTYQQGQTGGEATHTLTEAEMPQHCHAFRFKNNWSWNSGTGTGDFVDPSIYKWTSEQTVYNFINMSKQVGGNQPHNNLPPYVVTYCWKRTA